MLDYLTVSTARTGTYRPRASLGLKLSSASTIEATDPIWIAAIERRINQLLELRENWDSHGAPGIDFESAMGAMAFLLQHCLHDMPAPQVMPMSNGGIQIEWHVSGTDLELAFAPKEVASFYYSDVQGTEHEGELEQELLIVGSLLRGLPSEDELTGHNG